LLCERGGSNSLQSISKCEFSTSNGNKSQNEFNLASYARGTGGRSSFNGKCVTVFGANGIMGRILCNRLGRQGSQIVAAHRGSSWDLRHIKMTGDLGQVVFSVYKAIIY
jgi:NADH dehydrogenase (ubiquinone) 1 alpha subcomplex subunit 9